MNHALASPGALLAVGFAPVGSMRLFRRLDV